MCKINCSGGCPNCAPDEHAFHSWFQESSSTHIAAYKAWKKAALNKDLDDYDLLQLAFCAGYNKYKKENT